MGTHHTSWMGVLLLLLLVSHEGVAITSNIRTAHNLRQELSLDQSLQTINDVLEKGDVSNFMEVGNAQSLTHEIKEVHNILQGLAFKHSPVIDALNALTPVPEGKVLSPEELQMHQAEVTALLEEALVKIPPHAAAFLEEASLQTPRKRKPWDWLVGLVKSAFKKAFKKAMASYDHVKTLIQPNKAKDIVEETPTPSVLRELVDVKRFTDIIVGFVDGFFLGGISDLRDSLRKDFGTAECVAARDNFEVAVKNLWRGIQEELKEIQLQHIFSKDGRRFMIQNLKTVVKSALTLDNLIYEYVGNCGDGELAPKIKGVLKMIGAGLVVRIAMSVVGAILPMAINVIVALIKVIFAKEYFSETWKTFKEKRDQFRKDQCDEICADEMVESFYGLLGAAANVFSGAAPRGLKTVANLAAAIPWGSKYKKTCALEHTRFTIPYTQEAGASSWEQMNVVNAYDNEDVNFGTIFCPFHEKKWMKTYASYKEKFTGHIEKPSLLETSAATGLTALAMSSHGHTNIKFASAATCGQDDAAAVFHGVSGKEGDFVFGGAECSNLFACLLHVGENGESVKFTSDQATLEFHPDGDNVKYTYESSNSRRRRLLGRSGGRS